MSGKVKGTFAEMSALLGPQLQPRLEILERDLASGQNAISAGGGIDEATVLTILTQPGHLNLLSTSEMRQNKFGLGKASHSF